MIVIMMALARQVDLVISPEVDATVYVHIQFQLEIQTKSMTIGLRSNRKE